MKLITFNAENMASVRKGDATISFSRSASNGFSKRAIELMGFKAGDTISISQDEENPEDWYLHQDKNGFVLRESGTKNICFSNAAISNTILDALGIEEKTCTFMIAKYPTVVQKVTYWAILTSKPIIRKKK